MTKSARAGLAVAVAAALSAPAAFATNGYFAHGYGTKNKGLAGGGIALPQDAMHAATNPAGMVFVGDRMDLGAAIFSPRREYNVTGNPSGGAGTFPLEPGSVESDSEYFLIPHFGRNWTLGADSSFGITVYGNGGMNTDYPGHANPVRSSPACTGTGTFCAGPTGVDLAQLFFNASYARKLSPNSSWGVSGIFAYQRFKATGVGSFAQYSSDPANISDQGYDNSTGFGAKLGWQGEATPGLTLAASYQTEMQMSELDSYAGLFAEKGDFDIPATATVGLAFKATPASTVTFDLQKIWYSKINSVGNPINNLLTGCTPTPPAGPGVGSGCLGQSGGGGFGWDDMTIAKLGYQWQTSPDWTWRVGYSKGDHPIPSSEVVFNILAPAVIEQHYTFGFTTKTGTNSEFNFAAMYAPSNSVRGGNSFEAPGQQTVELKMDQFEVEASWGWKF